MNNDILIRRLTLIRYLFGIGQEQSKKSNLISGFCILSFHDAIEMFLKLLSEFKDKKSPQNFMDYWELFPSLTLKEPMRSLNKRRVSLKHHGQLPNEDGIEESRVFTREFFEQNTPKHFGIEFSEISLVDLLQFERTKGYLKKSEYFLNKEQFKESIEQSAFAFCELLEEYKENKKGKYKSDPFSFSERVSNPFGSYHSESTKMSRNLGEIIRGFNQNAIAIEKTVLLIALGINYRKFVKFNTLTPEYYHESNGSYRTIRESEAVIYNLQNAEFCLNFVVESGIDLQEVDFELAELRSE